jgi:purine-binding chemotaxis protein CheW
MSSSRYCTFHVADLTIGVAVERVEEVLRDRSVTPVPLSHPDVAGLINLRSRIVTAIDARRRLRVGALDELDASTVVVIHAADESVGLLVDRAADVVELRDADVGEVPETIAARFGALVTGTHLLEQTLLLLLDPDQMLAVAS